MPNQSRRYRYKITLEQPTETQDSYGDVTTTWTTLATVWAAIRHVKAREYFTAKQTNSESTVEFGFRYDDRLTNLNTKCRINWDSRTFDIESVVNEMEMDKKVIVMATEQT